MVWLTGILSFAVGMCIGAVLFKVFKSDAAKVELLEEQLEELQSGYEDYKSNVHSHFDTTARLVNDLSDSYCNVYRHLASGAQSLCPENISSQLFLAAQNQDLLRATNLNTENGNSSEELAPPRDYATKSSPDQKGNLAEDFGLDKITEE